MSGNESAGGEAKSAQERRREASDQSDDFEKVEHSLANKRRATGFIVTLGIVSLFSDAAYEGARAILGAYLARLGAASAVVGVVAGSGELLGYLARLLSGPAVDRSRKYWLYTGAGYLMNLLAIPAMGLVRTWPPLAGLVLAERGGKALRTPARDVMLSAAAKQIGTGWGFGLHEALDQIGAVAGPLFVASVLSLGAGYATGFLWLSIPVAAALTVLLYARIAYGPYGDPRSGESSQTTTHDLPESERWNFGSLIRGEFRLFLVAVAFAGAGLADFALIAFHAERRGIFAAAAIPAVFAMAMGVDGASALGFGRLFDRIGLAAPALAIAISAPFSLAAFSSTKIWVIVGAALWGIGLGAQESTMRSGVAVLTPPDRRGAAYGVLGAVFGISWFLGSVVIGFLYQISRPALVVFSMSCEVLAASLLAGLWRKKVRGRRLERLT